MVENNSLTAIFWDYENVGFSGENLSLFLSGLEEIKQKIEGDFVLKCFSHWNNVPETTQNTIMNAGFELSQVPQTKKNAVDEGDYHYEEHLRSPEIGKSGKHFEVGGKNIKILKS